MPKTGSNHTCFVVLGIDILLRTYWTYYWEIPSGDSDKSDKELIKCLGSFFKKAYVEKVF